MYDARRMTNLTVLNPTGFPPKVTAKPMAPRINTLDGKRVALATGSSMYLPGRPASLIGVEQLGSSDADEGGA